jgi:hypothetical protein
MRKWHEVSGLLRDQRGHRTALKCPPLTLFRHFGEGFSVSVPPVTYELIDSYRDAKAITIRQLMCTKH